MRVLLNSIALEPNRWTKDKIPAFDLATDLLPRIEKAGFKKVEVWQFHVSRKSLDEVKAVRAAGDALGLSFDIVGVYPKFHLEGVEAEEQRALYMGALDRAEILGAKWVKFFFGGVKGSEITPEQLAQTTHHVSEWLARGSEKGLRFCAELHGGTLFDPYAYGKQYLAEHPELDIKTCFQPYGFQDTEGSVALVEDQGARIVHAHFQGRDADGHCRLADSPLDYAKLVAALKKANPDFLPSVEFVKGGFPKEGQPFDFDAALGDAVADAQFIERYL